MKVMQECIIQAFAEFRRESNMSLRDLEQMGFSHGYISRVESRRKHPSTRFLLRAMQVIGNHFEKNTQQNQASQSLVGNHPIDII